jgi:hypothetical protein
LLPFVLLSGFDTPSLQWKLVSGILQLHICVHRSWERGRGRERAERIRTSYCSVL